ncbi:MAG: bifunctional phosphopantothenoylcysteine decarboxylase/phosphopantothenate--cysteine ligase CoaBC [Candidatus Gastranaerophilales bacterium]|nr:bifunctional phosphopantothenoylcysteine decarboxylase/phosphopantothenate--cysteine ligase CoaBC [Candidatus Gastranaerophilales bacterium]
MSNNILNGKNILLGVTGGIAAYKVCELIRMYKKNGANVKVLLTPAAKEFVTEVTLATLSQNPVYIEQFDAKNWKPEHISLADEADIFVIAPVSANTISKIANGIADNLLTSIACAFRKPFIIAPAMNCGMYKNNFIQENLDKLRTSGFNILEPEEGFLACGYEGKGRLAKIETIFDKTVEILTAQTLNLQGKKILITAGGSKEPIDPVRYIGNHSSGKMGLALADQAFAAGAEVTLVSTFEVNKPYKTLVAPTAIKMLEAVKQEFLLNDCLIMAAAVADFRVETPGKNKIKKTQSDTLTLNLVKNPDILFEISKIKTDNQIVAGFCAESENLIENAKSKLISKKADYIIANDISKNDTGFNSAYNEVVLIDKHGIRKEFQKDTKENIAYKILKEIL